MEESKASLPVFRQASAIPAPGMSRKVARTTAISSPTTRSTSARTKTCSPGGGGGRLIGGTSLHHPQKQSSSSSSSSSSSTMGGTTNSGLQRLPLHTLQPAAAAAATTTMGTKSNSTIQTKGKSSKIAEGPKKLTQPKRPNWDVKGMLEDEKAEKSKLLEVNVYQEGIIKAKNEQLLQQERKFRDTENCLFEAQQRIEGYKVIDIEWERKLAAAAESKKEVQIALKREIASEQSVTIQVRAALEQERQDRHEVEAELAKEKSTVRDLREVIANHEDRAITLNQQIQTFKNQVSALEEMMGARNVSITSLQEDLERSKAMIVDMEQQLQEGERTRRKLHNTIQELKGNIRVFCRVRPPLAQEDVATIRYPGDEQNSIELSSISENASGNAIDKTYPFSFDRVFVPGTTQSDVFEEISQLVQSALDGYNCCVFAYGQTSSGKTYTMEGNPDPETTGMIPRAVDQIFSSAVALQERGWRYSFEGQYLEIYNETINDLLGNKEFDKVKHEVKHEKGRTNVTDTAIVKLETPGEVFHLLSRATARRRVGETLMNARSSRSHSVFSLRITGVNSVTGETCEGVLNLVDLAGSERLNASGATGDRLKETVAINKSLSSLADVISALGEGSSHIPYRNSRLTYLLQNSLGGNSKTLMFVNISPLAAHLQETLCSLRFATKVNTTHIGTAKRQVKHAP